jgi:RNA polymerase sigma factor (sigma-70 family)
MEASRAAEPRARTPLRQAIFKPRVDRAFEQLYKRHAREVYQYALALLANPADAEDVTQTTFLNAYRAFQNGERPHKPHNWLITITHNVCRMRWRQAGSRPREVTLDEAPEPAARDDEQPNLDEVLTALSALSFNQRAAIVMRELEGRSYQEIAGVLGVSVSAVEALLFRARRNLQVRRRALGVLTTVPLPGSLASFVGGGGGAVAAGGATFGADLVFKAAAVVAVGTATAGVGYAGVKSVQAPHAQTPAAFVTPKSAPASHRATAQTHGQRQRRAKIIATRRGALRHVVAPKGGSQPARPTGGASGSLPASAPSATPPATPAATPPAPAPPPLPVPQLPPPPPVDIPPLPPLPPIPPLPPPPALPPPPPLPPLPPLPPIK